ncbi:TPA: B3/4 domain-containing protein [Streptococcus suis]|uniref:B3/B4 domain-containing protein n=1 Tax=Streptococcus suis TaxID=1307 RepID=UPI001ABE21CE|nr:B3/4 domain-containing protein [Streptococcus suis]MBO4108946.1 B3/4 domain-containing protein [Streptococcus suis]MDG3135589.1 B3/4 domain-containing protein [Streptococcus suis]HEM3611089.1 B3/4 domain-containing protein [Streptococcus suis]HEM3613442.1 B3/4 domain-containing protein [Streptococcus suis]HEM3621330.1 B3/4 domain-containing protein [Streptococcus suis]
MSQFVVDSSFWSLFPDAKIGVLLLKDYKTPSESPEDLVKLLEESNEIAQKFLTEDTFSENEVIQTYRQAYQKFKTKKGARSSIEALLKRSASDRPVSTISPLVDIYNAASLRFGLPCGAEDIDTFVGNLQLTITEGGDEFYLIGDETNNPTLPGEVCYKDDKGAVCRCFNWRDGERTMITDETKNAFLVMELVNSDRVEDLENALDFISQHAEKFLGVVPEKYLLDRDTPAIAL